MVHEKTWYTWHINTDIAHMWYKQMWNKSKYGTHVVHKIQYTWHMSIDMAHKQTCHTWYISRDPAHM